MAKHAHNNMVKINLDTPILAMSGKQLTIPMLDEKGKPKQQKVTLRMWLLVALNMRFDMIDVAKEPFWTNELGMLCADEKNKTIEISDEKAKFLQRVIETNKFSVLSVKDGQAQKEEINYFTPFEMGAALKALGKKED